ncbi:MAG: SDR family NAD(P)-dependent oxidoreductase [Paracoccaceae bacterium]|nr:SDR family NAD(P)-dependent oxidoreductase [Paracoccaceae bacterium]
MARALVTGGNRGIGRAIAEGLVAKGLEVVIGARDKAAGEAVAAEIGARAVGLDLMATEGFAAALEAAGPVDVLVNNAGILNSVSLLGPDSDFDAAMQVMVHAPYALIRAVHTHMAAEGYGRIVNMSSGWGAFSEGLGGPGAYGVAKASLNALTKAMARDVARGVKINAMCPGWVRTRMGSAGANLSPEEGADTAIWLATLPEDGPSGKFFRRRAEIAW